MKKQFEATKQQVSTLKSDNKKLLTGEVVLSADLALPSCFAERQKTANSLTMPSQHTSISMHSLHPHHSHSQHRQHQHHPQQQRSRGDMDDRGYMPHPQQQRSPSHNPVNSSPKHYPTHVGPPGSGGPPGPGGDTFHSSSQMYQNQRRSSEESPDLRKIADHISEHRRMSADHANRDHTSRVSADHAGRTHSSRVSGNGRSQHEQSHAYSHKHSPKTGHNFVETTTNDTKFSQNWGEGEEGSGTDITITLQDETGEKSKTSSSNSTLIEEDTSQHLAIPPAKQDLSQEPFGEEEMLSLVETPETAPNLYYDPASYFGEHQENYPTPKITGQSLSQSSPPKSHHRKSLTDLTGSSISLTSHQFLSQSAIAIHDLRNSSGDRRPRMSSHKHLPHMSSDTHLNKPHIPGLKSSVISALSEVREELEHRKQQSRERRGQTSHPHPHTTNSQHSHHPVQAQQRTPQHAQHRSSQLQQKHLKATEVRGGGGTAKKMSSDRR